MRTTLLLLMTLSLAALAAACGQSRSDFVGIDAKGTAVGLVWVDRNGNGTLDGSDGPVPNVTVELAQRENGRTEATRSSGPSGEVIFDGIPVGNYVARVAAAGIPDTLRLLRVDSANVTVTYGDTAAFLVSLTFPALPIDSARHQPPETRVFIEGLALTGWRTFADSTVHVRDSTGAIRAVRVPPVAVATGDSVRLLGRIGIDAGAPVLKDVQATIVRTAVRTPEAIPVNARTAAGADNGRLDAELVHLDSVVVRDTATDNRGNMTLTVNDGSGSVNVVLDADVGFRVFFPSSVLGSIMDISGVLVPRAAGEWVVKPRTAADVVVGPLSYPLLTIAAARDRPVGTRLQVEGTALNTWSTFGDAILHVRDATGAIRAFQVPATTIASGDSVRLVGTVDVAYGQPVLTNVQTTLLHAGIQPAQPSDVVSTLMASTARSGQLDAGLVRVMGATIQDTARTAGGDRVFIVNDGSGPLSVVLDAQVPFYLSWPADGSGRPVIIGTRISATGLLVPAPLPAGSWILKPRGTADITIQ